MMAIFYTFLSLESSDDVSLNIYEKFGILFLNESTDCP